MSISANVLQRIQRMKRGVPFSISRFYELGSEAAVQKAMSRLAEDGIIERVAKGMYVRPKPLPSIPSIKVKTSAVTVARVWAKEHRYTLVPQGLEAAYRLGLQTQAPMKTIFWSDGPSRTFSVGNEVVEVRHIAKQKLRWSGRPEGELLRGLSVTPPTAVGLPALRKAFRRLGLTRSESHAVVERLKSSSLPKAWQEKLAELETRMPA
ncbi:DUF6088 family protein [Marinobacterium aestuariivivens]|uniref:DUF6088 family protein n=1 Tax=Marinobacterium aestuariivivens TaxID=1698799 RepID=A0ABW2A9D0_9GAMM